MTKKIFFLALNTGFSTNEEPSDEALNFYRERSGNGLYCAIVGNVLLPLGFGTNDVCMRMSKSQQWRRLANAIKSQGAKPGVQLSTTWPSYVGITGFTPKKGIKPKAGYEAAIAALPQGFAENLFGDLRRATVQAVEAGFTHIQLHAAHGYLFSLLIDPCFYPDTQETIANIREWVELVRELGAESSVRISMTSGSSECDENKRRQSLDFLFDLDVGFFDISDGYYNFNKHLIYPAKEEALKKRHLTTLEIAKSFPKQEFIVSGRADFRVVSEDRNVHLGICRDLIANPNFLVDKQYGCVNSMHCHFYSTGRPKMSCKQWANDSVKS